jgi:hypothetical protein
MQLVGLIPKPGTIEKGKCVLLTWIRLDHSEKFEPPLAGYKMV